MQAIGMWNHMSLLPKKMIRAWRERRNTKRKARRPVSFESRRTFLHAGGSGVALAMLAGCTSIGKPSSEETALARRIEKLVKQKPFITELRGGHSVKVVVELLHRAQKTEIAIVKNHPGVVWEAGREADVRNVRIHPVLGRVRSALHTHNFEEQNARELERLVTSNVSPEDIQSFVQNAFGDSVLVGQRFDHMACVSAKGEVVGYFSMQLGRKLRTIATTSSGKESKDYFLFSKALNKMHVLSFLFYNARGLGESQKYFQQLLDQYRVLHTLGLRMRVTPMPGFTYKDGYFQPKQA